MHRLDHNNKFILGGDYNSLSYNSLAQTGLQSIYYGPTHKGNNLDRLYGINIDPTLFNPNTYVSHIKTHHLGVIALPLNIAPSHMIISQNLLILSILQLIVFSTSFILLNK